MQTKAFFEQGKTDHIDDLCGHVVMMTYMSAWPLLALAPVAFKKASIFLRQ